MTGATPVSYRSVDFAPVDLDIERRDDGVIILQSKIPLRQFEPNLLITLGKQVASQPGKTYLAMRRGRERTWHHQTFAATKSETDAITQWFLNSGWTRDRPLLILSGNSIAHAMMKLGAMGAGVPVCPVSVNYSKMGGDFSRLRHVVQLVNPGVIFAEEGAPFEAALHAIDLQGRQVVTCHPEELTIPAISYDDVIATPVEGDLEKRIHAIDPDQAAVYMLTSGSTGMPKAVIQTHRMIAANLVQAHQAFGQTAGWHDIMMDWLPWSHVSGAFNMFAPIMFGGTLYIDEGKPVPGLFDETLRNLKEISLPYFANMPVGYSMLADALGKDEDLRASFFRRIRMLLYGGAGLPQPLYDRFQDLAVQTVGKRILFTTAYGSTETTSGCMVIYFHSEKVGIGLPTPGLQVKLVPDGDRYEIRMKGPNITPGYLNMPEKSEEIFDQEGFYKMGDTARFHDPDKPERGLVFAGRLAEEFKLGTGTWVSGGEVRAAVIAALAPVVSDLILCGGNRDYLAVLAVPHLEGMRQVTGDNAAGLGELRDHPYVTAFIKANFESYNQKNAGQSRRICRFQFTATMPRPDRNELSDKGTINQALSMANRADEIDALYSDPPGDGILVL